MGQLIVIEGTDGSGKATQTKILASKLKEKGYKVRVFDFPRYGKKSAKFIEMYLRGEFGSSEQVNPYAASLFYAIDRYFAADEIKQALKSEDFVILDRYTTSNMGHQACKIKDLIKREEFLKWLVDLEYNKLGIPKPDKVFFLYLPPVQAQELVRKKGFREYLKNSKDIHEEDVNHLTKASEAYMYAAKLYGWIKIDCLKNGKIMAKQDIADMIWEKLFSETKKEGS